jgi:thiol-disulfide isomerase/thioredoxin
MLLGTHCPFCPAVLASLGELVKRGVIGRLEAVNLDSHPEIARELGVRGVPWVRIGSFELSGNRSPAELEAWARKAGSVEGMADYFAERLSEGAVNDVAAHLRRRPDDFGAILTLLGDPELKINVRVGLGAVIEDFAGDELLRRHLSAFGELTRHRDARVRADAAHYLALAGSPEGIPWLRERLEDENADVREIARESLDVLGHGAPA